MSLKETYKILPTLLIVDKISTFTVLLFLLLPTENEI